MEILKTIVNVRKFKTSDNNLQEHISGFEKREFRINANFENPPQVFELLLNFYLSNPTNEFFLEVEVEVIIEFDTHKKSPTDTELYGLYVLGISKSREEVNFSAEKVNVFETIEWIPTSDKIVIPEILDAIKSSI